MHFTPATDWRGRQGAQQTLGPHAFSARSRPHWSLTYIRGPRRRCPLLAQSGHSATEFQCPLLGVKQTSAALSKMSASLIGRFGSSAIRLLHRYRAMSLTGSCFSPESAPGPFHHGIRERGGPIFRAASPFDERRSKRTCDLAPSIVPRGTSCHRAVELAFPPIAFDLAWSCSCSLGPSELGAVNPDAMHDHG